MNFASSKLEFNLSFELDENNYIFPQINCDSYYSPCYSAEEYQIIDKESSKIIENMPDNLTTYGKYKYLAICLANNVEYDYEEFEKEKEIEGYISIAHNMYSAFSRKKAVCTGYAEAYRYLCQRANLFCKRIDSSDDEALDEGENEHEFNYIKLGDKLYFVDVTWMDTGTEINYDYFAFNEENDSEEHSQYLKKKFNYYKKHPEMDTDRLLSNIGILNWSKLAKNLLND